MRRSACTLRGASGDSAAGTDFDVFRCVLLVLETRNSSTWAEPFFIQLWQRNPMCESKSFHLCTTSQLGAAGPGESDGRVWEAITQIETCRSLCSSARRASCPARRPEWAAEL